MVLLISAGTTEGHFKMKTPDEGHQGGLVLARPGTCNPEETGLNRLSLLSVPLPLFTVVGMDRFEEDVIISCGLYLLTEEEKRKKRKYLIRKVSGTREMEGKFHALEV
jgi:hypothetical protein